MPWAPYGDTILRFNGAGFELDLRRAVGEDDRKELRRLGLSASFAVVTACIPLGRVIDAASNRRLTAQLDAVVGPESPGAVAAAGVSPDGVMSSPAGRSLGRWLGWKRWRRDSSNGPCSGMTASTSTSCRSLQPSRGYASPSGAPTP